MRLMSERKLLDKISATLHINKNTAFDWWHKILRSLKQDDGSSFSRITESDYTLFEKSDKGCRHLKRKPHKRGRESKGKGIFMDKATVIVTVDKKHDLNMTSCGYGRLTKVKITESLHTSSAPRDCAAFGRPCQLQGIHNGYHTKHVVIRADLDRHIKMEFVHIQHVNSLHNKLKKWLNGTSTCRTT